MPLVPPHALALYLKLCALIKQRKWAAAYTLADSLDLTMEFTR